MLITSALPLFDSIENGFTNAIINLCDCFGNISSPNSIEIRVKYPGSYAADRMTRKGDLHKLGTVSCSLENNTLVLNAYICYNFNDRMSIDNATLFDPTIFLLACIKLKMFYQITILLVSISQLLVLLNSVLSHLLYLAY